MMDQAQDRLKVLVPVDFSEPARRALAWAFDYAARAPCELHLLHVVEDHLGDSLSGLARQRMAAELGAIAAAAEAELERMLPDPEERAAVPVVRHVTHGKPAPEILRIADKLGAEMIVMGAHGRSGLDRLLIGSVAEKIVRGARCPVVCVKPGPGRGASGSSASR